MSRQVILGAALVAALWVPEHALAHEGHAHKLMGVVTTVRENQLEVKATGGKTSTITLTDTTKILRGKTAADVRDIKRGERVVVTQIETKDKDGKPTLVATEVRLGAAATHGAREGGGTPPR